MHYMIEWITFGSEEFLHCSVLIWPSIEERFSLSAQYGAHEGGHRFDSISAIGLFCFVGFLLFCPSSL